MTDQTPQHEGKPGWNGKNEPPEDLKHRGMTEEQGESIKKSMADETRGSHEPNLLERDGDTSAEGE